MKTYEPTQIRNIGLYGHQGSGKTTLGEAILFLGKTTTRLCSVTDGNSNFDFEAEEVRRRSSMSTAVAYAEWDRRLLNVVDTPGDTNFWADTVLSLVATDIGVLTVSAVDGIQVGTQKAFHLLAEARIPRIIVVTKMDKERADFDRVFQSLVAAFGGQVVPLGIPIGSEASFRGLVDLLHRRARVYSGTPNGQDAEVPADLAEKVASYREKLVEKLAEQDDALIEKYFAEGDLPPEDLERALAVGLKNATVVPVVVLNGAQGVGADFLMDLVDKYGPNPLERPKYRVRKGEAEEEVESNPGGPLLAYCFKTIVDVHAGKISILRVISGAMSPDGSFVNLVTGTQERYGQIVKLVGKKQESVPQAVTGDLVAVVKLKDTRTTHTLASDRSAGLLVTPPLPDRCIAYAIKPKTQGDEDKVSAAVQKLVEEDIGLAFTRDVEANDLLLEGLGQVHLETAVERLKRKFGVDIEMRPRRVPYRETIRGSAKNVEGKHKKQTGGHGQFGVCYIDMEPLPRGQGFEFEDKIFGGAIPRQYIPSVEKGIRDAMARGVIAGYPVVDVRVRLVDGKYHEVDSDNRSFEMAGSRAFKAAFKQCRPVILEPIMNMTILIPEENLGDIMGDVSARRGRVLGMEAAGPGMQVVKAAVPMSEVLTYASDLRSMTSDRGSFTMELAGYEELPAHLAEKLIQEARPEEEEE